MKRRMFTLNWFPSTLKQVRNPIWQDRDIIHNIQHSVMESKIVCLNQPFLLFFGASYGITHKTVNVPQELACETIRKHFAKQAYMPAIRGVPCYLFAKKTRDLVTQALRTVYPQPTFTRWSKCIKPCKLNRIVRPRPCCPHI